MIKKNNHIKTSLFLQINQFNLFKILSHKMNVKIKNQNQAMFSKLLNFNKSSFNSNNQNGKLIY